MRALEEERPDALVTDLRMPSIDGLQLLAVSRKLDPNRPVIVMTASARLTARSKSIRQGAYHYMMKPFKVAELGLFLAKALDEARVRREAATLRRALRDRFDSGTSSGTQRGDEGRGRFRSSASRTRTRRCSSSARRGQGRGSSPARSTRAAREAAARSWR